MDNFCLGHITGDVSNVDNTTPAIPFIVIIIIIVSGSPVVIIIVSIICGICQYWTAVILLSKPGFQFHLKTGKKQIFYRP